MNILFHDYDIPHDDNRWKNFKNNCMVKITITNIYGNESFWVWVESINNNQITGTGKYRY